MMTVSSSKKRTKARPPKQRDPLTAVRQDLGLLLDEAAADVQQRALMDAEVEATRRWLEALYDYFIATGWTAAAGSAAPPRGLKPSPQFIIPQQV